MINQERTGEASCAPGDFQGSGDGTGHLGTGHLGTDERAAAERYLLDVEAHVTVLGAFVSGSVAAGLGNASSDIDLSVVVGGAVPAAFGPQPLSSGRRIDSSFVTPQRLERLARRISSFRVTHRDRRQLKLTKDALQDSVRFATSIDVRSSAIVSALRRSVDDTGLRRLLTAYSAGRVANCIEDAYGAVRSRDWPTAVEASSLVVTEACEVLLADHGDFYVSPTNKFLATRLARHPALAQYCDLAWRLRHVTGARPPAEAAARSLVDERLQFASWLVGSCLVDGWDSPADPGEFRMPPPGTLRRNPFFGLMRFKEGLSMYGPDPGTAFDISDSTAKLWTLLDGSPFETVVHRLARWSGLPAGELYEPVSASLRDMRDIGAVLGVVGAPPPGTG